MLLVATHMQMSPAYLGGSGKTEDPAAVSNPCSAPSELCDLGQVNVTSSSLRVLICRMRLITGPPS